MPNEDSQQVVRRFVRATSVKALALGLIAGGALFVFWSRQVAFGYAVGSVISVVYFNLMALDTLDLEGQGAKSAKKFFISRYVLRFLILLAAAALIATRTDFNIFAVFAGVFAVQTIFLGERLFGWLSVRIPMKV